MGHARPPARPSGGAIVASGSSRVLAPSRKYTCIWPCRSPTRPRPTYSSLPCRRRAERGGAPAAVLISTSLLSLQGEKKKIQGPSLLVGCAPHGWLACLSASKTQIGSGKGKKSAAKERKKRGFLRSQPQSLKRDAHTTQTMHPVIIPAPNAGSRARAGSDGILPRRRGPDDYKA